MLKTPETVDENQGDDPNLLGFIKFIMEELTIHCRCVCPNQPLEALAATVTAAAAAACTLILLPGTWVPSMADLQQLETSIFCVFIVHHIFKIFK